MAGAPSHYHDRHPHASQARSAPYRIPFRRARGRRGWAGHRAGCPCGPGPILAGTREVTAPPGVSSCGPAAWIRADGKAFGVGDCAADLLIPAQSVTVRVGQQIGVQMLEQEASPGSSRVLVPVYPLPHSTVLARTFVSSDQATATYTAVHPGHAALITKADCLPSGTLRSEPKVCPVIDVTVISGPRIPGTVVGHPRRWRPRLAGCNRLDLDKPGAELTSDAADHYARLAGLDAMQCRAISNVYANLSSW